ncbi:MAG: hypothetical protein HQ564_07390 [Candidatus Saganbacteria bacterium]|nr:hypothetical protein [Candidatus Saganbacteria bacterium]
MRKNGFYPYYYFGFNLHSDFSIDDLKKNGKEPPDVWICAKENHSKNVDKTLLDLILENPQKFFTIEGLNNVSFDSIIHKLDNSWKIRLLNYALSHLSLKRGIISIHGSAINYNNRGIIFAGSSGSGKSTIAAAFCKMGHSYLSDDRTYINRQNGKNYIATDRGNLKLKKDAITHLNISAKETGQEKDKFEFDFKSYRSKKTRLVLSRIYCLQPDTNCNNISLFRMPRIDSLKTLIKNDGTGSIIPRNDYSNKIFNLFYDLSIQVPVISIKYPKRSSSITELTKKIELDCRNSV